jgi:hypothetical protein
MSLAFLIPTELIVIILSYLTDDYKIRQGSLVKRINKKTDTRYKLLKEIIPRNMFSTGSSITLCIFDEHSELTATYHLLGRKYGFDCSLSKCTPNTVNSELEQYVTMFRNYCGKNGCGYNRKCICEKETYFNDHFIKKVVEERKLRK